MSAVQSISQLKGEIARLAATVASQSATITSLGTSIGDLSNSLTTVTDRNKQLGDVNKQLTEEMIRYRSTQVSESEGQEVHQVHQVGDENVQQQQQMRLPCGGKNGRKRGRNGTPLKNKRGRHSSSPPAAMEVAAVHNTASAAAMAEIDYPEFRVNPRDPDDVTEKRLMAYEVEKAEYLRLSAGATSAPTNPYAVVRGGRQQGKGKGGRGGGREGRKVAIDLTDTVGSTANANPISGRGRGISNLPSWMTDATAGVAAGTPS